ncbi:MAG: hypothetical protein IJ295_00075 [Clostridia bacterium]|nr:hypothetical protein [Clostridia bacterium]
MKRELINLIAMIGLVLLCGALVLGGLTAVLFIFPNLNFFGAKSVNERDTQIVYSDPVLTDAFANGKFILDSTGTKIEVKMSKADSDEEGTIVVNESATGIAFNSLNRTLIEWTQTIYNEELYYRIKVLEPSGVVFKNKPTTVHINLPHRATGDSFTHDFVLQNGYSDVNFSFADNTASSTDALKIGSLVVESATSVNIPANSNISVGSITVNANKTKLVCQSPISGDVIVTGESGKQTINTEIGGKVEISGNNNDFSGDSAGDVKFECLNGRLSMNQVDSIYVHTLDAAVNVGSVQGGAEVRTVNGNFNADKIVGGLKFVAGYIDKPVATAVLTVDELSGNVDVKNYGVGSINLSKVNGNVDINSSQTNGDDINVEFADAASNCSVTVLGYDGDINIKGINGIASIEVLNWQNGAGAANVNLHFNHVVGESKIWTGGYVSGHHEWGNVNISLDNTCNNFNLYVYGASSTKAASKYKFNDNKLTNSTEAELVANEVINKSGSVSGAVHVYSKQTVSLF